MDPNRRLSERIKVRGLPLIQWMCLKEQSDDIFPLNCFPLIDILPSHPL
jgi:hypothetical protein